MLVEIIISETFGSVPRDVGTTMWVYDDGRYEGTIGGGALEYKAIAIAQEMLGGDSDYSDKHSVQLPLGPMTGQCCGGFVRLGFSIVKKPTEKPSKPLQKIYIYGAGNVGMALFHALKPLPFKASRVDDRPEYEAEYQDLYETAECAPLGAWHLIMTYSHAVDQKLCEILLSKKTAGYIGLIGSHTKKARFSRQLRALDIDPSPIVCPIGIAGVVGKEPAVIAASVVCELLLLRGSQSL